MNNAVHYVEVRDGDTPSWIRDREPYSRDEAISNARKWIAGYGEGSARVVAVTTVVTTEYIDPSIP
jgi:hypothetical protein